MNPPKFRRPRSRHRQRAIKAQTAEAPLDELSPDSAKRLEEHLLERIAQGATLCRDVEAQLRQYPAPELETIIKVFRVLVLKLSAEVRAVPQLRHLVSTLIKPALDWARLEEQRKARESEHSRRKKEAADKTAINSEAKNHEQALRPQTLEKIEHELKLF